MQSQDISSIHLTKMKGVMFLIMPPKKKPATYITYFFTVALNNGSMFATPVDSSGTLVPITKYLLDPVDYYKKRSEIKN